MKAHVVRDWFEIEVLRQLQGHATLEKGLATEAVRAFELARERDLIYLELQVCYRGERPQPVSWDAFALEDSEGFMIDPRAPADAIDLRLEGGQSGTGGVLFGLYEDLQPARLWLDTGIRYEHGADTILIEVMVEENLPRRPVTWQEEAALGLERQMSEEIGEGASVLPLFETGSLMNEVSRVLGMPYKRLGRGYMFRVALAKGRTQYVLMNFSGRDEEGADLIKFLTLCGPVGDGSQNLAFLRANPKLSYGGVGIVCIEGQDLYVLSNSQLVATADVEELSKSVAYLAQQGDTLEAQLTGGEDLR